MTATQMLNGRVVLHAADCLDVLARLPENSIDACVTDPPYHLTSIVKRFGGEGAAPTDDSKHGGAFKRASAGFMGKTWDGGDIAFRPELWAAVCRVLKPGGHLLAFSASRNFGLMQVAIEQGGFETRDCILNVIDADPGVRAFLNSLNAEQYGAFERIVTEASDVGGLMAWMFGSGFPKSHNVALDFEKSLCVVYELPGGGSEWRYADGEVMRRQAPFRDPRANRFAGFGTALKPAFEPIVMARKPLAGGSVAENAEQFGTGPLNIDAARIGMRHARPLNRNESIGFGGSGAQGAIVDGGAGRWPANVIHDGSDAVISAFPISAGAQGDVSGTEPSDCHSGVYSGPRNRVAMAKRGDAGSSARFFYSAKADANDRVGSKHPTVKPVDLMQYLVRLVTEKGATVLDPFAGTGTTGEAAFREGRKAVLIEREAEYQADIQRRMALCLAGPDERKRESIKAKSDDKPFEAGSLFARL